MTNWKDLYNNHRAHVETVHVRIHHGGCFVESCRGKLDYLGGSVMLNGDLLLNEVRYKELYDYCKTHIGFEYGDGFELFYQSTPGKSLAKGIRKYDESCNVSSFWNSKDKNGGVDVYVVAIGSDGPSLQAHVNSPIEMPIRSPINMLSIRSKNPSYMSHSQKKLTPRRKTQIHVERSNESVSDGELEEVSDEFEDDVAIEYEDDVDAEFEDDVNTEFEDDVDIEFEDDVEAIEGVVDGTLGAVEGTTELVPRIGGGDDGVYYVDDLEYNSDDLVSLIDSDEEKDPYEEFHPSSEFDRNIELKVGLKFPSNDVLRRALCSHAIENGYDFYYTHNERNRVSVFCKLRCDCPFKKMKKRHEKDCKIVCSRSMQRS